ncbi:MAG: ABC transporter substrate-binding protein [Chloroflexota bacterium]|nr:ABC transporter substrate-binding protein [Chloroflexota bacterium]
MRPKARISRRAALAGIGGIAASSILAACGGSTAATPTTAGKAPTTAAIVPQIVTPVAVVGTAASASSAAPAGPTAAAASAVSAANPTAASGAVKRGGQLRIMQINDFVSMDPIFASGPTASACYDWLLAWRPNAQGQFGVQPQLAKAWDVSGNTIVFKLQENVKFHDGSPLDADAVVWNLKRMVQNPKSFAANYLPAVDKNNPAQTINPLTVQLNLTRPSDAILSSLSDAINNAAIVSKKAADDHGEDWLKTNAVGTGPFKFVSFASGDKLVVTKNESYWQMGADGKPLPYADGATYRVIIEATTQFNEMRAGTADFMQNVPGRNVAAAKQIATARYIESPFAGSKRQFFFNAIKPPFKDNLKLRQAIEYAIDRDAMAKALGQGIGIPLPYEFVPGAIGYDNTVPAYGLDLDKAKTLIKESGVTLPLTVRLTAHNREVDTQQAQLIQAMLDKIGVKINLDIVERVAWGDKVRINNDFEMATRLSGVAVDPTNDLLVTWAEGGNSAYSRAKVPGLLDTLNQADGSYDDKTRQQSFVKAQNLMYESAWFGYMWFELGNFLVDKRIQNFPNVWGSLRESEWWINQ